MQQESLQGRLKCKPTLSYRNHI